MKNFFLLLKFLIKSYDLLLNLLVPQQVQLLLLNNSRILGLTIEEDGEVVEGDTVVDTGMVLGVVLMEVLMGIMDTTVVLGVVLMEVLMEVLRDITDNTKGLLEVTVALTVVVEEENGDIMLRNLKNKRCVLLRKSR
jgi:hypothetical protein